MAKLWFFASIKEKVGRESMDIPVNGAMTVRDLLEAAARDLSLDPNVLINSSLLYAVNQESAGLDHQVRDADEVAALPPLSGGV